MARVLHGTTDSTNERALAALADGDAQHLDVHVADAQTAGRGRHGRPWVSAPGEGLFLSLVWRPTRLASGAALTVAAGLGALEGLRALGAADARLAWPNDLVAGGAKLAGVLVETRGLDPAAPAYVVGVGVNVAQRTFPGWLTTERAVTSLSLLGVEAGVGEVEDAVVARLVRTLERIEADPTGLARDYLEAGGFTGAVTATTAEAELVGTVVGLDLVEGLALETAAGPTRVPLERLRRLTP